MIGLQSNRGAIRTPNGNGAARRALRPPAAGAMHFHLEHGTVSIPSLNLEGGVIRFRFGLLTAGSDQLSWQQEGSSVTAERDGVQFLVHLKPRGIAFGVRNLGREPLRLLDIALQFAPAAQKSPPVAEDFMEFIHSQGFEHLCGTKRVGLPNRWLKAEATSHMVYVLQHRADRRAWLFSTLPPHAGDLVSFRALHDAPHLQGHFGIEIRSQCDCTIPAGATASTSRIQCRTGTDPLALLSELGEQWQQARTLPQKHTRVGWNSWDYFAGSVAPADVLANAAQLRETFAVSTPDIVIDDGWEARWGNWEPNERFAEGLEWLAGRISHDGGVPGIWTAPLMVHVYTRLYRDHLDWLVRDRNGKIFQSGFSNGPCGVLDITHPQVRQFLHETFVRLKACGFRTFKVDFTQFILRGEMFHDPSVPRGALTRKTFQVIRDAIGPECYLVSCGAPFETVSDLADAVRITADIHNYWSHVLASLSGISARWWMHRTLWNNDPDFLIVRTPANCPNVALNRPGNSKPFEFDDWWLSGPQMNDREARTYALLILLSAGDLLLGDHLPVMNEDGRAIIRRVLAHRLTRPAVPLDLFESHEGRPSLWLADEPGRWLIGLFNWEEDATDLCVELAHLGIPKSSVVTSFWDDQPVEVKEGQIRVRLEPHACLGLCIRKSEAPGDA